MSRKLNGYELKIELMFQQVNSAIRQMLSNLSYIYQSHGIKYRMDDKFQSVVRILTPFEILSYFHITPIDTLVDPKQITFWKTKERNAMKRQAEVYKTEYFESEESLAAKIKPSGGFAFGNFKNYLGLKHEKKMEKEIKQESEKLKRIQMVNEIKVSPVHSKPYVHKGLLTQDQERKISKWIQFNFESGHMVSKSDTIKQARILSEGAVGSTGWARGFFARNPHLLAYIKRAKPTERSQITFMNRVDHPFKNGQDFEKPSLTQKQQKPEVTPGQNDDQNDQELKYYADSLARSEDYSSENFKEQQRSEKIYDDNDDEENWSS